jgi:hypothetical protein
MKKLASLVAATAIVGALWTPAPATAHESCSLTESLSKTSTGNIRGTGKWACTGQHQELFVNVSISGPNSNENWNECNWCYTVSTATAVNCRSGTYKLVVFSEAYNRFGLLVHAGKHSVTRTFSC